MESGAFGALGLDIMICDALAPVCEGNTKGSKGN